MEAKKRKITEFFKKPSSVDSEVQNEDIILEEDSQENDPCSTAEVEELSRPEDRTFQISWLKRWDWLSYDRDEGMFCKLCKETRQAGDMMKAFVGYGCKVLKMSSMTRHSKSRRHIEALELKKIQAHSNIEKAAAKVVEAKYTAVLAKKGLQLKSKVACLC